MTVTIRQVGIALCVGVLASGCMANPEPPPIAEPGRDQVVTGEPTPTAVVVPTTAENGRSQLTVGIDTLGTGFNPHLSGDDTAVTQSIADLVLPSAFIDWQLNSTLLTSAEVIAPANGAAQTVRYTIAAEAQWSDGTPITGADFHYLWEQMVTTPGVIEAAGYRAIADVRVLNQGKTVEVDFTQPVANWRALFADLLPSHIFVGGAAPFSEVLDDAIPASAGKYMVRSVDRARGVITLNRNDRYWGPDPATIDIVNFQEVRGSAASLIRAGQVAFVDMAPEETTLTQLSLLPDVQTRVRDREVELTVAFNQNSPLVATPAERAEVARSLDPRVIAQVAFQRSSELALRAAPTFTPAPTGSTTPQAGESTSAPVERIVRVAADPRNAVATAAAQAIVDTVNLTHPAGLAATLVAELPSATNADLLVEWLRPGDLSFYQCDSVANVTGFCDEAVDAAIAAAVAGNLARSDLSGLLTAANSTQVITLPIAADRRIDIAPDPAQSGVAGPAPRLEDWPVTPGVGVLPTLPLWRLQ
ncbi:MAG: ABC transporter family substrate-binding protein [Corynebacterium sp.]|nr:ABC transporter family substrate-binding protein [Corynebacterium sp.]